MRVGLPSEMVGCWVIVEVMVAKRRRSVERSFIVFLFWERDAKEREKRRM